MSCLLAGSAAGEGPPPYLRFSVQDEDGNFFPTGEVEFCLPGGECLYSDIDRGLPGYFLLPRDELQSGRTYTVMVYNPDVDVIYETWSWTYVAEDYDPGYDRLLQTEKFQIHPRFQGVKGGGLTFEISTTLNPEWELRAGLADAQTHPDSVQHHPGVVVGVQAPLQLGGRFRSDPAAAGGVLSTSVGAGVELAWRSGYPGRLIESESWVPFRELAFAYAGNRYETAEVITPGRTSDVTFHRLQAAYGIGRLSPDGRSHWNLSLTAGVGAVMDGTALLEFDGRTYRMFGAGVRGRFIREIFGGEGVRTGVALQGEVMYWAADASENDFWHGLAPSVALGLAFY